MFPFLETDVREQKSYEKRIQTSVDKTVNDLRYEIKFENHVKDKNNFFIKRNISFFKQKYISYLETYFCRVPENLIALVFFLLRQVLKNRYASAKASAFVDCRSEF